ncbi:MAG: hypothetical protein KatS3mg076_0884 [Candidatus Binatia bacterium]|nr:MAG: hypothetical protein KatS3mg076_0884 [Candidatus Binatia bacterium]
MPSLAKPRCFEDGSPTRPVSSRTVSSLVREEAGELLPEPHFLCQSPDCPTVYVSASRRHRIPKSDLTVRVGFKKKEDPILLCYCFGYDRRWVREEVRRQGYTDVQAVITARVRAGECRCEETNPRGRCCLGEIAKAVREAKELRAKGPPVRTGSKEEKKMTQTSSCCGPRKDEVDLAIVGGGSAAFAAAIRAADLGASVLLVEKGRLGGTCVNVGCVPSKTLIRAAEVFWRAGHHDFAGVRTDAAGIDFGRVVEQKDELVSRLQQEKYWDVLAAYPSVELVRGRARFGDDGKLHVDGALVEARRILVATGASPWVPPIPGLEGVSYRTSTEAMELRRLPSTLIVLGGGAVGLELAQAFARFGSKVTVVEALPRILPAEDAEIASALGEYLEAEGIEIRRGAAVRGVERGARGVRVQLEGLVLEAEELLVATGRRPNTAGLGLESAGIRTGKKGEVLVDEYLETSRTGVYAAGDVLGDPMFVYVAAHAGALAAENALLGNRRRYDVRVLPRVTFTDPAVASVGLTEEEARGRGVPVAVSRLPMAAVPRALAARDTRGLVKLVAHAETGEILGAHALAPEAGEMIQEAALAIRFGMTTGDLASLLHPYLTNAEAWKLAAQGFEKDVSKLSCCAA